MKVHILPAFGGIDKGDGGIRRVIEAQKRYLPDLGVEIVDSIEAADVVHTHAGDLPEVPVGKPWICSNHGLYWAEYTWADWSYKLNQRVIEALRRADIVTAPSEWVAYALQRGMWLRPHVLYHGIDPDLWWPEPHGGYVLWNKTRVDPICDQGPLDALAQRLPAVKFLTTFGKTKPNVKVTGKVPFETARTMVRHAHIYLATTRETMGIGTLEAMACGVPILGWNWGGQREVIRHKETGWLATPGDVAGLVEGYHWLVEHRAAVGAAAREDCLKRFSWETVMLDYAQLYEWREPPGPKVSVVMPCYNLVRYLPDAIKSVQAQTLQDWELIIVDDHSPDETYAVASEFARGDPRIKVHRNETNLYLAGALNTGMGMAKGRYLLPLDADNMIAPRTLEVLSDFLDGERQYHIAYGSVQFVTEDLQPDTSISPDGISVWPRNFDFRQQMMHRNQIPSTCMFRKVVWERTGGYRSRWRTAEDAAFWTHATSYGFRPAKCTTMVTLIYRNRHDSMSRINEEPDWTAWVPWAKRLELTPFGAPVDQDLPVPTYEPAKFTVVIPVGPGHEKLVIDALDSVEAQTYRAWRCIVVNDTGKPLSIPHPWAQVLDTEGRIGVAAARNMGIEASKTECFVLLDADDILEPLALETYNSIYEPNYVVYSQWWDDKGVKPIAVYDPPEFDPDLLIKKGCLHAVTACYPKDAWRKAGGFDPSMANWEDWDFQIALADAGVCSVKCNRPLWTYRKTTGLRREDALANYDRGKKEMLAKWKKYWEGGHKFMGCAGCGRPRARVTPSVTPIDTSMKKQGAVLFEYTGAAQTQNYRGRATGKVYRFGRDEGHRRRWVFAADAPSLDQMVMFRRVPAPPATTEPSLA